MTYGHGLVVLNYVGIKNIKFDLIIVSTSIFVPANFLEFIAVL